MHSDPEEEQEHEVTMRLVVTRRMPGATSSEKRHKAVKALTKLLSNLGGSGSRTYRVDLAEHVHTRRVR
jgi:hypothetical protein